VERRPRQQAAGSRPLTPREAAIAFGRARVRLLECSSQHSDSVTRNEGEINLAVIVEQSGLVKDASITSQPVGSPALDRCIVERVKTIQFRSHPDREVRINVPFVYRVKS
jgi:TonB family protein